tara:strand:- start:241 stop:417 length:177 start_codon:yes stop_codon:yes gene_type:complete
MGKTFTDKLEGYEKILQKQKTDRIWDYMCSSGSPFHGFGGEWKLKYKDGVMTIRLEDE